MQVYEDEMRNNWLTKRISWYTSAMRFAWKGTPFKIWLVLCTIGIIVGIATDVGMTQLCLLVAIAILGLGLEVANSAIEHLCNLVEPRHNPGVKTVKDAFGAVPALIYSGYVVCWLILVAPTIWLKVVG